MVLFKRLASAVALLRSLIMPLRLRLRDDLYPSTWANVEMKKVKRAVIFLKCALRCASSHQGQKRLAGSSCARACGARKMFFKHLTARLRSPRFPFGRLRVVSGKTLKSGPDTCSGVGALSRTKPAVPTALSDVCGGLGLRSKRFIGHINWTGLTKCARYQTYVQILSIDKSFLFMRY